MIDKELAIKAFRLGKKGLKPSEIGKKLGLSAVDAVLMDRMGSRIARVESSQLTKNELAVLRALAAIERQNINDGVTSSPKSKYVSWRCRKHDGWCRAVVAKRLFKDRVEDKSTPSGWRDGLGLVNHSSNGHIYLTAAGWAMVHALESGT